MSFRRKQPMGTFRRGLTASPFQIPLLAYLFLGGIATIPGVDELAADLHVPEWSVWNFVVVLIVGAGLATLSRFTGNERLEEFGLWLTGLAVVISIVIQIAAHEYTLGDEAAVLLGCLLRIRTLRKARKAEHVAVQIVEEGEQD